MDGRRENVRSIPNQDGKTVKPITPLSRDCLTSIYEEQGPKEGTVEHVIMEKKQGFNYRTLLGELMYSYVTSRLDIGYTITTLSKILIHTCRM